MKKPLLIATQVFAIAFWLALAVFILTHCTGCAGVDVRRNNAALISSLPQPVHSVCPELDARVVKEVWNAAHPEEKEVVSINSGKSMLPLIPANGACSVVRRVPYADIKPGMIIVYRAKWAHKNVQHVASYKSPWGYAMQGLNNDRFDPEYCTPSNYLGVTVAIFAP